MTRVFAGLGLVLSGSAAAAATPTDFGTAAPAAAQTDFGIREAGVMPYTPASSNRTQSAGPTWTSLSSRSIDMRAAASLGARWGTVTSTYRSPEHNRRVGGVRNSYHLRGRAIDIARRPGVSHYQIAAAYRAAGYHLIESLDEGDHSHFAFGAPGSGRRPTATAASAKQSGEVTAWRIVSAPGTFR